MSEIPGTTRHQHWFHALWSHLGPHGPGDVHYHPCCEGEPGGCHAVLMGAGRVCGGKGSPHERMILTKDGPQPAGALERLRTAGDGPGGGDPEPIRSPASGKPPAGMRAERDRLAAAFDHTCTRVQAVLDKALGTEDRAGEGLAADVALLAGQRDRLAAALHRLASGDWLGTEGYDGDELTRRREYASDVLKSAGADAGSLSAAERDLIRADLGQLLELLGLGDYARPESPHEVFQQCLAEVLRVTTDRNDLSHLNTSQASRIRELNAALSSLADRAEAGKVITWDEAGEYRSLIAAPVLVPDDEDDESPGYWQVRAALSGALNALQLVALSPYGDIAAMAKDELAKADAALEGEPERDLRAEAKLAEATTNAISLIGEYRRWAEAPPGAHIDPATGPEIRVNAWEWMLRAAAALSDLLAIVGGAETSPDKTSSERLVLCPGCLHDGVLDRVTDQLVRAETKLAEVRSVLLEGGQDAPTARRRALAIIGTGETPGAASEEKNNG